VIGPVPAASQNEVVGVKLSSIIGSSSANAAMRRAFIAAFIAGLALPPSPVMSSCVVMNCSDCPVGLRERASLARFLREYDVVFEGNFVRADSAGPGYDRGSPLATFRVERLLRGRMPTGEARMRPSLTEWGDLPPPNTRVLGWMLRGCTFDGHPCGSFVRITEQRTMSWHMVDSDWRRDESPLSCDSLEHDVALEPDSTGLEVFDEVIGVALARLESNDPVNRPHGFTYSGQPNNGGTWPVIELEWILGFSERAPRYVRFIRAGRRHAVATSADSIDQFLLPIRKGSLGDTLVANTRWLPMLVRHGVCLGFGIPLYSLPSLYDDDGTTYRLKGRISN
jgi:hypothetical protein